MKIASRLTGWPPLIVLAVILAILPAIGAPKALILFLFLFLIYLSMSTIWNLLAGYTGLISLCQPAFIGLAGYSLVIFTWNSLPIYCGVIAAIVVAAIFAVIISFPTFRLSGIYFAIGTLVVPEILRIIFYIWRPVGNELQGGGGGYSIKGAAMFTSVHLYWMALVAALISIVVVRIILRSKLGLGLAAIRDSDRTAANSGINVFNVKLTVFAVGAMMTAITGSVFYLSQQYIEPISGFSISWTMLMLLATVIGGMRTEIGPVVGAIIVTALHFYLAKYAGLSLLIQGIILVIIMLLAPEGIVGFINKLRYRHSYRRIMETAARHEAEGD